MSENKKISQKKIFRYMKTDKDFFKNLNRIKNKKQKKIVDVPRPFVKWAGGKRQIINRMDRFFPEEFDTYIEPFLGGGAIFFYLLPSKAILIDINPELINTYQVIQEDVVKLSESLKKHENEKEYYYKLRNIDRNLEEFNKWSKIEKASRTIYLNRCCYNGLYRVNSKGQYNVPFGKYKNPNFCDEKNLWAVHEALKNVKIIQGGFERVLEFAEKGDFIYFDPPYHPLSETSNFTSYTKFDFGKESQIRLFEVFKELDKKGCKLLLSNSYNEFIIKLYKDYKIVTINAKRAINSDASKRGKIKEVLVMNS